MSKIAFDIRPEGLDDHKEIHKLIRTAFEDEPYSDKREHFLVDRLRDKGLHVPELCLVATTGNTLLGHIFMSRIAIRSPHNRFDALALAPVSIVPEYQGKGIGSALIETVHQKARRLQFKRIVLVGHEGYYERFGYQHTADHDIQFPFDVPVENGFILGLNPGALKGVEGMVEYPPDFFE